MKRQFSCRIFVRDGMKHQKFEIAVAGYDYRFKTYARDVVEASVKVKCFLGKPDAECTILVPALNDYLRETESCRRQDVYKRQVSCCSGRH